MGEFTIYNECVREEMLLPSHPCHPQQSPRAHRDLRRTRESFIGLPCGVYLAAIFQGLRL